jgi:hypothetical protein
VLEVVEDGMLERIDLGVFSPSAAIAPSMDSKVAGPIPPRTEDIVTDSVASD